MTETLLQVAYGLSDGLSELPRWAVVAWLALLFAAVLRPGIKAVLGDD
jgi:hypothetical protein